MNAREHVAYLDSLLGPRPSRPTGCEINPLFGMAFSQRRVPHLQRTVQWTANLGPGLRLILQLDQKRQSPAPVLPTRTGTDGCAVADQRGLARSSNESVKSC